MTNLSESEILRQFRDAMAAMGLRTSDALEPYDGEVRRFHVDGDPRGTRNGWYVLFVDGLPAGEFGSWRSGVQATWAANGDRLTPDESRAVRKRIEAARKKREAEERARQGEAAKAANQLLNAAQPANDDHPYLTRKRVRAHGLAVADWPLRNSDGEVYDHVANTLLVPIMDARGRVVSLQGIFPAKRGTFGRDKDFMKDGRKRGCFFMIGKPQPGKPVAICEGYATAAKVHELTGWCAVVAFDAYNLRPVAEALCEVMPGELFVICADNDQWTETPVKNPGVTKAREAGQAIRARVLVPEFTDLDGQPTDWDDLAVREGDDVAQRQLTAFLMPVAANDNTPICPALTDPVNLYGFPDLSEKNQPMNTRENLEYLLSSYGITVRYNQITKKADILIPGFVAAADTYDNAALSEILSICARNRMPQSNVPGYMSTISGRNPHNPVRDWILSEPWDGVGRFDSLAATIEPAEGYPVEMRDALLRRWLISAVAAAFKPDGFEAHGALVFTGPQGTGKTRWFKRLAPADRKLVLVGATLDPANKDTIITAVSHWLVELGELDATFRKADIARLKSFITQSVDKVRKPYDRLDSEMQRRTVFCASVNEANYLVDDTGNRRWWTVAVERMDYQHAIDMQQLWAEVLTWFDAGEQWHLTADENARLRAINEGHEQSDPIAELILASYDPKAPEANHMSASEVLRTIGYNPPTSGQAGKAGKALAKLGFRRSKNAGRQGFWMPRQRHDSW